jgi:hypothetical protein
MVLMIILFYQLFDITISYFRFEKSIKIDVKRYYEDLTLPAITIGFKTFEDIKNGKFEKIFDQKCFEELKKIENKELRNEIIIDCIHSSNVSKNVLMKYPTYEEFNSYFKVRVNDFDFNITSKSNPIKGWDLSWDALDTEGLLKTFTFIFDDRSDELFFSKEMNENLLTILFDLKIFKKLKRISRIAGRETFIFIHSSQIPIFMDKNVIHNNENSIANYRTVNYMNTTLFIQ